MPPVVLLEDAHADGSGAPGERVWSKALNDRIVPLLAARGIGTVRVAGTTLDNPLYEKDYLCFITNHYDADIYGHTGGGFWDRAAASFSADEDDLLGAIVWGKFRQLVGAPANHFERKNANTRDYYAFRYTNTVTPGVIFEWGVGAPVCNGHGRPTAPDHDWLRANIDAIALVIAEGVLAFKLAQEGETPVASPLRAGQSADLKIIQGTVEFIHGIWKWGNKPPRPISRKVYAQTPGRFIYTMYPPADPDADPTEDLGAEPCIFVVDVRPS